MNIKTRKISKIILLLCFVYQLIDLTVDYLKYEYVVVVEWEEISGFVPSITVCVNKSLEMKLYIKDSKRMPVICEFISFSYHEDCKNLDDQVYLRYKKNTICF